MATETQVTKVASKFGATIETSEGSWFSMIVDAPDGRVWSANGCTCLMVTWNRGEKAEAMADLLERMSYGIEEAEDAT